jgi:hypothetical protein
MTINQYYQVLFAYYENMSESRMICCTKCGAFNADYAIVCIQ